MEIKWMSFIVDNAVSQLEAKSFIAKMHDRGFPFPQNHVSENISTEAIYDERVQSVFESFVHCGIKCALFFVLAPARKKLKTWIVIKGLEEYGIVTQLINENTVHRSANYPVIADSINSEFMRKLQAKNSS